MGIFHRKNGHDAGESLEDEVDTLRAVLMHYPSGHRLRVGDRCSCPKCGANSQVVSGPKSTESTSHRCNDCQHTWSITQRAIQAMVQEAIDGEELLHRVKAMVAAVSSAGQPLQLLLAGADGTQMKVVRTVLASVIPDAVQIFSVDNQIDGERNAMLGFDLTLVDPESFRLDPYNVVKEFSENCPGVAVCFLVRDPELAKVASAKGCTALSKLGVEEMIRRGNKGTAELLESMLRASRVKRPEAAAAS